MGWRWGDIRKGMKGPRNLTMHQHRLHAVDAARGTAMLAVFLSHFLYAYGTVHEHFVLPGLLLHVSMLASPTFMIVSGMMLGLLYASHRDNYGPTRTRFINRGVLLLTVARVLIMGAHIPISGSVAGAFRWGFITDNIGLSMIAGSLIVDRVTAPVRAAAGTALFVLSTIAAAFWVPGGTAAVVVKEMSVGVPYGSGVFTEFFPLLPWFGIYLAGSALGEAVGRRVEEGIRIAPFVLKLGIILLLAAGAGKIASLVLSARPAGDTAPIAALLGIITKRPPSPAYTLFYGGIGLLILAFYFRLEESGWRLRSLLDVLRMSGSVSLFVFVVQYYAFFALLIEIRPPETHWWPAYFLALVAGILASARLWAVRRGTASSMRLRPQLRSPA